MEKEKIAKAKIVLTRDIEHARLLIASASSVSSPVITGMPKGSGSTGHQEDLLIDCAAAEQLISDVKKAIALLDIPEQVVLKGLYFEGLSVSELAERLHVGPATVYRRRTRGLDDFCYAFRGGELLADSVSDLVTA